MGGFARLGIIVGGLFAACGAGAATVMLGTPDLVCSKIGFFFCGIIFVALSLNALVIAALPALLLILITEARSVRSITIYLGFGAVIGSLPLLRAPLIETAGSVITWQNLPMIGAGLIGGLVYWVIAGRRAGDWPQPAESTS